MDLEAARKVRKETLKEMSAKKDSQNEQPPALLRSKKKASKGRYKRQISEQSDECEDSLSEVEVSEDITGSNIEAE